MGKASAANLTLSEIPIVIGDVFIAVQKSPVLRAIRMYFLPLDILVIGLFSGCQPRVDDSTIVKSANGSDIVLERTSDSCRECHSDIFDNWKMSDHANANRRFVADEWNDAFSPTRYLTMGGVTSVFETRNGVASIETIGPDNQRHQYSPEMVLAHRPLVQFLIPFEGGRWQTTELAWDVQQKNWFDVYGDELRRPEEWGHWTQRGMNWNAQCAICHTSAYSKNYDSETDTYASSWKEMGISCQQCHGEMPVHKALPDEPLSAPETLSADAYYESCCSCHSRREDLTGQFRIGDQYSDHHRLQLPVEERYYFPDGQIKDEVFVYGSFLMSKMYQKEVRCLDCHDPHSLKLKLPFENNSLCMRCHQSPGTNGALPIDPVAHSHHSEQSIGNRCVECHMPERVYMQRDPRRDHGFHTPDPLLSDELEVPNACMNCHNKPDEGKEWVTSAFVEWYENSENLESKRNHARLIQSGYERKISAKPSLLNLLTSETSPIWRAAIIQMISEMGLNRDDIARIASYLNDESPLVRDAVVQGLSQFPAMDDMMKPLIHDSSRLVRIDASWYLRNDLIPESVNEQELFHYMNYTSDQPGGALRKANFHAERGDKTEALKWINKVVKWDSTSPDAWIQRGLMLHQFTDDSAAIASFEQASRLAPDSAVPLAYLAMLTGEAGDPNASRSAWERVLRVDPLYGRAWYNLGLLMAQSGNTLAALSYLDQGIAVSPDDPDTTRIFPTPKPHYCFNQGNTISQPTPSNTSCCCIPIICPESDYWKKSIG